MSGGNAATAGTFGTIQVNADGSYVYTLTSPFTEPTANNGTDTVNAAESFTYRVTDAVGNTATGTININIVDDVPSITANATTNTLTVDETNLAVNDTQAFATSFASSFGADGAGTITYALNVVAGPSGLVDTATNEAVNLVLNGTTVEGRTATTNRWCSR